eukprot:SAG11_NODE_2170_length_3724_cov_2.188690_3_plen_104_part_00
MANAMGVEAVITTFAVGDVAVPSADGERSSSRPITPDDMGDLVEYSFGDASTKWGRMRIEQDQHPAIYNWSYIELGESACIRERSRSSIRPSPFDTDKRTIVV